MCHLWHVPSLCVLVQLVGVCRPRHYACLYVLYLLVLVCHVISSHTSHQASSSIIDFARNTAQLMYDLIDASGF